MADAGRLQQVVWNLLSNAVKFTPAGGSVAVTASASEAEIRITVTDTGIGIDGEVLPRIFDRFHQGDSSTTRQHGGLGLGLALVKKIVELHGGTVEAASPGRDQGATFVVRLPRRAVARTEPAGERGAPRAAGEPLELHGVTVLVVDDQADAREMCAAALGHYGAMVETADSARQGWERLEAARPDVVLVDLSMPGEDGFSLGRRLRAHESGRGRRIPAIAVTAYASVDDRLRVLGGGFDAHVPKPFDPGRLVGVIRSLLPR
jgi:CheY-like chemotaxis protein